MALPHDASDAALVARLAEGDHAALDLLWQRHADAVHDHLARWTQDAELAAAATVAAFTALLDDVAAGTAPTAVRPGLLRTARSHASRLLASEDHPGPAVPPAVLAASGATTTTPGAAAAAWTAANDLGAPWFSVLDLTVRQGSSSRDLATILGQPEAAVQDLLATVERRVDAATRTAYGALATLPAPVAARTAVTRAAVTALGAPRPLATTLRLWAVGALGGVALLVLAVGGINALRGSDVVPTAGTATAAAEPVPSPTPEVDPSPTPTLDALASPSEVPMASPEPTVPAPTPSPSPTPTPDPTPTTSVLTVAIDDPASGAAFAATTQDAAGRPAAVVPVVATVSGASEDASIVWTSDLAPDRTLLTSASGDLLLWLPDPCTDAQHVVTVTVTDPVDDQTAAASIPVQLLETCEEPPEVTIEAPERVEAGPPDGDGTRRVSVPVRATSQDTELEWSWSVEGGTLVAAPSGAEGTVEFDIQGCTIEQVVTLRVDVTRTADQATAEDTAQVTVECPPLG